MQISLYCYRALIKSVYDGDTCTADIDLGLKTWIHGEKLRLHRINTPELRGKDHEAGLAARDYLKGLIDNKEVLLQTVRDSKGKYGRYLAEIWLLQSDGKWLNVNDQMIASGHASYYLDKPESLSEDLNNIS